ncbi:MAG: hypothetical protein AAF550_08975 [Myxococcota bacterium]
MDPSPSQPPKQTIRSMVLFSAALSFIGTCGIQRGVTDIDPPPTPEATESRSELEAANHNTVAAIAETTFSAPWRAKLGAMNIVLSFMLIAAAILLATRSRHAIWWTQQSLIANALWTVADMTSIAQSMLEAKPELVDLLTVQAHLTDPDTDSAFMANTSYWLFVASIVIAGIARLLVYVYAAFWLRRSEVQTLIPPTNETP